MYWKFTSLHEPLFAEKVACCEEASEGIAHGPTDVIDLLISAVSLKDESQSEFILHEIFSNSDLATSDSLLKEELYQVGNISI